MPTKLEEVERAALELPADQRAKLIKHLVESLGEESEAEIELAWADEAERRYQEANTDASAVEPAAAAFKRARNALR